MIKYKYSNEAQTAVNDIENGIYGIHPGINLWADVEEWISKGNTIEPFETQQEISDREKKELSLQKYRDKLKQVQEYEKLKALANMTPTQISNWVDNNITTAADMKDVIKTLAIAVSVLTQRI